MQKFMAGRCVREGVVGRPCSSGNWVVVGSSEEEMLSSGFSRMEHAPFVFQHSETTRKHMPLQEPTSETEFSSSVRCFVGGGFGRRGFTIDAMAKSKCGVLLISSAVIATWS